MGGGSSKKPKCNNDSTLRDTLREMIEEEPETDNELLELLMDLSMNEIIQISSKKLLISEGKSIGKIRQPLKRLIATKNKSAKDLAKEYAIFYSQSFQVSQEFSNKLVPGVDPVVILNDIFTQYLENIINLTLDGELSDTDYSNKLRASLCLIAGESLNGLTEGFNNDRFLAIQFIKFNLERNVADCFEEMEFVLKSIGGIDNLMKLYVDFHSDYTKNKEEILKLLDVKRSQNTVVNRNMN